MTTICELTVSLDASRVAWGGCLHLPNAAHRTDGTTSVPTVAQGAWSPSQVAEYIHVLEMCAVLNTLTMFQEHLHHKVVRLLCDNSVVVSAIRDGFSRSQELCTILCTLHLLLLQLDLALILQRIPSKSNAAADWLSRVNMSDNYRVRPTVIQALEHHFGLIDIDRFAMAANAICK